MTDSEPVTVECNSVSTACKSLKFHKSNMTLSKNKTKQTKKNKTKQEIAPDWLTITPCGTMVISCKHFSKCL